LADEKLTPEEAHEIMKNLYGGRIPKEPMIVDTGATQALPVVDLCEKCQRPWETGMFPFCKGNPADHGAHLKHSPFPSFEVDGVGEISSITQLREVEHSSMEAFKEGRGQPLIFRAFSQDNSNRDQNVFGRPDQGAKKRPNIQLRRTRGE
jgi:hypothetical protein